MSSKSGTDNSGGRLEDKVPPLSSVCEKLSYPASKQELRVRDLENRVLPNSFVSLSSFSHLSFAEDAEACEDNELPRAEFPSKPPSALPLQQAWSTHGLLFQILHLVSCYVCDKAALLLTCLIPTRSGWNHQLAWSQKPNAWKAGCSLYSLISFGADSRGLVILGAVDVGAVVEGAVAAADGPAPALVDKVPVEAGVGPVLSALVLHEQRALLRAEFLQVPAGTGMWAPGCWGRDNALSLSLSLSQPRGASITDIAVLPHPPCFPSQDGGWELLLFVMARYPLHTQEWNESWNHFLSGSFWRGFSWA